MLRQRRLVLLLVGETGGRGARGRRRQDPETLPPTGAENHDLGIVWMGRGFGEAAEHEGVDVEVVGARII